MKWVTFTPLRIAIIGLVGIGISLALFNADTIGNTIINRTLTVSLQDGLVGHWTFDGKDMSPLVEDISGNDNDGNLNGQTSTTTVPGRIGQALDFDGSDDYVQNDFSSITSYPFTLSAWTNSATTTNQEIVWLGDKDVSSSYYSLKVRFNDSGAFTVDARDGGGNNNLGSGVYADGNWHHIVGVYRSATDREIFVDGVSKGTDSTSVAFINPAPDRFAIGREAGSTADKYHEGSVDDVRIYDRALSSREAKKLYDLGATTHINKTLVANTNLNVGLVGHWTFDGKNMSPLVEDISGNDNDGELNGQTSTTTVPGRIGQALDLSKVDTDNVDAGNDSSLDITNTVSISAWIYPTAWNHWDAVAMKTTSSSWNDGYGMFHVSGNFQFFVDHYSTNVAQITPPSLNQWHHVVGTYDGSDVRIFVDKVEGTSDAYTGSIGSTSNSLFIGKDAGGNAYDGLIDDVRIYDRALSAAEISRLYDLGATTHVGMTLTANPNLERGLEAHWTFDGKDMTPLVQDRSGNGNHGTLNGQTSTTTAIGKVGQALELGGSDEYINLGAGTGLSYEGDFEGTLATWVKFDTVTNGDIDLIYAAEDWVAITFDIGLVGDGTNRYFRYRADDGGSGIDRLVGPHNLVSGEWYHLTVTSDGSTIKAYIDGSPIGLSVDASTNDGDWFGDTDVGSSPHRIGSQWNDEGPPDYSHLDGALDDLRIYNRPLSEREIRQLYNLGAPRKIYVNTLPDPSDSGRYPSNTTDLGGGDQNVTLRMNEWLDPEGDDLEYYFEVFAGVQVCTGSPSENSGWISDPTATGGHTVFVPDLNYTAWRVKSRDGVGSESDWNTCYWFDNYGGGSCPFLYVWDGESFDLETDIYGSGKVGAKSKLGYIQPNPHDYYLLNNTPVPVDGLYEMRLVEERVEINYLDELKLYSIDIPQDRDVYAKMPMFGGTYKGLEGELHTVSMDLQLPEDVIHTNTGESVLATISASDDNYTTLNEDNNIDFEYQTLEIDLGDLSDAQQIKLILDAITVFPDSPEGVSHKANFGPRMKMEVLDQGGDWVSVSEETAELPLPKALKRPFAMDISDIFLTNDYRVRLTFLFKTYVDSILFDTTPDEEITVTEVPLTEASLRSYGISEKTQVYEDIYAYDYNEEDPNHEHSYLPGAYTKFGGVLPLLEKLDDKFVIFGNGDEISLTFDADYENPTDLKRVFMLYSVGYYKDTTIDVIQSVEPMPFSGMSSFPYDEKTEQYPDGSEHTLYIEDWNTRLYP